MRRTLVAAGVIGVCGGVGGCADTWDTVTSRSFRDRPWHGTFGQDDPLHTLRTVPADDGAKRARAMTRLQEPLTHGGTRADQDEVVDHVLGPAATGDPSPVVRAVAIDTLGRFKDERATTYLIAAYHQATGRPADAGRPPPSDPLRQVGFVTAQGRELGPAPDKISLSGPTGYPADTVGLLRAKALDGLARAGRPDGVRLIAQVAAGDVPGGDVPDRDARLAAVRGLGLVRQPESVAALSKVFAAEAGKDTALAGRAHAELVQLTGKDLPADPDKWGGVVQAGATVAPAEPTLLGRVWPGR